MESRDPIPDERPPQLGYLVAIVVSAIGHAVLALLVFFVLPQYLNSQRPTPEAYTVKIVGELPAGDLGTHLPKLSSRAHPPKAEQPPPPEESNAEEPALGTEKEPPPPPENDKNAIALNTVQSPVPTAEPTAIPAMTPAPTPEITPVPTPEPTRELAPTPLRTPSPAVPAARPHPKRRPKPQRTPTRTERRKPEAKPSILVAKAESTPSVQERLNQVREQLLKQHLANKEGGAADEDEAGASAPETGDGGPVVASRETEGKGTGVGPGTEGGGVQQAPEFLLYYRTVQDSVKKAWSFSGGKSDLETTVTFAIGADGNLTGVKITQSSRDAAYDDSVIRAIRRAAPFPPPPEKYRSMFAGGVEAVFRLGELSS